MPNGISLNRWKMGVFCSAGSVICGTQCVGSDAQESVFRSRETVSKKECWAERSWPLLLIFRRPAPAVWGYGSVGFCGLEPGELN
jgi:hypothetical protein